MAAGAAFNLAGRLAPAIAKAGGKFANLLGAGKGAGTVKNVTAAAVKNLRNEGVATALNQAVAPAVSEAILGTIETGNPLVGGAAGLSSLGTGAILGTVANSQRVPEGVRNVAANPLTQEIVVNAAAGGTLGLLGRNTNSTASQTITPEQHVELAQLRAQMQANQLSAQSQDLLSALNAGNAVSTSAATGLSQAAQYGPGNFTGIA
jgi:hypothetical protein